MSIVPSGNNGVTGITSTNGSGINVNTSFGITTLSSALVAGSNVALTPLLGGKGLTISASPGTAGVASVTAGNSGITIGGTAIAPTVANSGVLALTAGTGITVANVPDASHPTITNDGIVDMIAGTGIVVDTTVLGTPHKPYVGNSGVLSVTTVAGRGITVSGTAANPQISNAGVLTLTAGTGITTTGTAQNPVINNNGVASLAITGAGLANTGTATAPNLQNTGITSIVGGSNITATTVAGVTTISAVAGAGVGAGAGISVTSNVVSLAFSPPSYITFPSATSPANPTVWSPTTNVLRLNGGAPSYYFLSIDETTGTCNVQVLINPTNYGGTAQPTPQGVPLAYLFNANGDSIVPLKLYFFVQPASGGAIYYTGYSTTLAQNGVASDVVTYTVSPNGQPFPTTANLVMIWKNGVFVLGLATAY
jgi:hypothetical protein